MTVERLLRLYPRAWRERYGTEFADLVGERPLTFQQTVDILAGAIDAWMSPSVRASVRGATAGSKQRGDVMIQQLKLRCATGKIRYTKTDGLIAASIMIGVTIVIMLAASWARQSGYIEAGKALAGIAFYVSMALSMPFWLMKGQSRLAQTMIVGSTVVFLVLIAVLSTKI